MDQAPAVTRGKTARELRYWAMSNSNPERVAARLRAAIPEDGDGCWIWPGTKLKNGYGTIRAGQGSKNGRIYVHRASYEHFVGPIPDGLQIDHTCHNQAAARGECAGGSSCAHRPCFRPDHLEPATNRTNYLRGDHPNAVAHRTATCRKGLHPLAGDNVMVSADGRVRCRACNYEWQRQRRARRATARAAA